MIIVKVLGGLGNQMFQYSFYTSLINQGYSVKLDISDFDDYTLHNGFELSKIFDVDYVVASKSEIKYLSDRTSNLSSKIRKKIFGRRKSYIDEKNFIPGLLNTSSDYYLEGYWQSEIFFKECRENVLKTYIFKNKFEEKNIKVIDYIKEQESISIHIRRGDYISNSSAFRDYGTICNLSYYQDAIQLIKSKVSNPILIIFSDDIPWVKENLKTDIPRTYVDWNKGSDSYIDMQLMSLCKHNIIANSSFSWWGAWLNKNENKTVIAPSKWKLSDDFNKHRTPVDWITIQV